MVKPTVLELQKHRSATHCCHCKRPFTNIGTASSLDDDINCLEFDDELNLIFNSDDSNDDEISESGPSRNKKTKLIPQVIKTYHHSHDGGHYISSLCQVCNLKIRYKNELTLVAHNASKFDFHLLLKHLDSPLFGLKDIKVISKSKETFIQIQITAQSMYIPDQNIEYGKKPIFKKNFNGNRKVKIRMIDSFNFLPSSLARLADNLVKDKSHLLKLVETVVKQHLIPKRTIRNDYEISEDTIKLLMQKLPYPYTFLTSPKVLESGNSIPGISYFHNELTNTNCTLGEWEAIQHLIKTFGITDFQKYTHLYTVLDSTLLSLVWVNFVHNSMKSYGLDPTYTATASGFAWQAFLYTTGSDIHYIRDKEMINFIRRGVRGGNAFAVRKICTSNNKRNPHFKFDSAKPESAIVYFDIVSLYSYVMQYNSFPHSNSEWVDPEALNKIDWRYPQKMDPNTGYILEVSLEYPDEIHDATSDLPFCPVKTSIQLCELSKTQVKNLHALDKTTQRSFLTTPKLLLHQYDRDNYVIHYQTLAFYLLKGMKLKTVHKGIRFTQKAFLKKYIKYNVDKRKLATSECERDSLKLGNNSIFGRLLMKDDNLVDVVFCTSRADVHKMLASDRCIDFDIINENVSIVILKKSKIVLDKPIQVGFTVLDLAKNKFYSAYYDDLKGVFGANISLLYTDTDSCLTVVNEPENILWKLLVENRNLFDFSKIRKSHQIFSLYKHIENLSTYNAGESGKIKIEDLDISQTVTLKSKQYSILTYDGSSEMKAKGLPSNAVKRFCNHETYKDIVESGKERRVDINVIRSKSHNLFQATINKLAFHNLDLYRCYPDENDYNFSLPFGHYSLRNKNNVKNK
ncbi:unnamed protein product [Allacma fusca]|uniref:DNA-directed DNA polymerase n=1 Tax=Allacma fusca TaxID=39272 RepID=A0A8J2JS17_9HEXA|nr:unnamed protein product [Allacma fusca]